MSWLHLMSYFFGGAVLTNAIPHFVCGVMGRALPTPFAKPPGVGLSSSSVNLLWGAANLVIGYLLVCRVGDFDIRSTGHAVAFGLGAVLLGLMLARHFGRINEGNTPMRS